MTPMIVEHPLLQHKISLLRNKQTGTKEFRDLVGEIHEGDILIVEHDGKALTAIYCKDDDEKNRRIQEIVSMMKV